MASVVLDNLAAGTGVAEILRLYPALKKQDILAVMAFHRANVPVIP
jgi:uncharacterized protein (DUF433 family)